MNRQISMLTLAVMLAFTGGVEASGYWRQTITRSTNTTQSVTNEGTDWEKISHRYPDGSCVAWAKAHDQTSPYDTSSNTDISVHNSVRKRYDWVSTGSRSSSPTTVTANVNVQIALSAQCQGSVTEQNGAITSAHAYASGSASKTGGTPNATSSGHVKIDLSVEYQASSSWTWTISIGLSPGVTHSQTQTGIASSKYKTDSNTVHLGGGLQFNQSGAQVHIQTYARAKGSQNQGYFGVGRADVDVNTFDFSIP